MAGKKARAKVSFSSLKIETGSARAVPGLVRDLANPASHDKACRGLADRLIPFNRINEATGPALELILQSLLEPHPHRRSVIELALHLAEVDSPDALFAVGMDADRPELARYGAGAGAAIRAAIDNSAATLLQLLRDEDAAVRLGSARLLGYARGQATEVLPLLVERLDLEESAMVIPWLALAAYQLHFAGKDAVSAIERAATRVATPVTRGMSAVLVGSLTARVPDDGIPVVRDALLAAMEPFDARDTLRPWRPGFCDGAMLAVLGEGPLGDIGRLWAARAVIAAGDAATTDRRVWISNMIDAWTARVLRWFFKPGADAHNSLRTAPVVASDLSDVQREILLGLSSFENHNLTDWYLRYGLPQDIRSRRRMLGAEPASVLEQEAEPGRPLFRIVLDAFALDGRKDAFLAHLSPFIAGFTRAQRLDLWTELLSGAYWFQTFSILLDGQKILLTEVEGASRAEILTWADRHRELLARTPDRRAREAVGFDIVYGLCTKLDDDEELPERFDTIMAMFGQPAYLRAIFARMKSDRAVAIFRRALSTSSLDQGTACEKAAALSDLHPPLAQAVLEYFAGVGRAPISGVLDAWRAIRSTSPELDRVLDAAGIR